MAETTNQFTKKPRQVAPKGKRVTISAEARAAYEEQMRARDERERTYTRHLPGPDNKPNR
ncbi:hypothetical protein [Enterovirga sp.]|uniref:hypothetical protein n=1 Tax=Enterovirga sp. TaxID=2026350 RepID=UPI002630CA07|nr:hypothetical protein [Enterovirga sp.]MDB5592472.1 hypothetical protein [Enterovirga sp.]